MKSALSTAVKSLEIPGRILGFRRFYEQRPGAYLCRRGAKIFGHNIGEALLGVLDTVCGRRPLPRIHSAVDTAAQTPTFASQSSFETNFPFELPLV